MDSESNPDGYKGTKDATPDNEREPHDKQKLEIKETQSSSTSMQDNSSKRNFTEVSNEPEEDEETKRKKRKDVESGKESVKNGAAKFTSNKNGSGADKCSKVPVVKTIVISSVNSSTSTSNYSVSGSNINTKCTYTLSNTSLEGKNSVVFSSSVNNSQKLNNLSNIGSIVKPAVSDADTDNDDGKNVKTTVSGPVDVLASGSNWTAGPKVPPLKIVIPPQSSSQEQDQGVRNGKNGTRHQALPYVVPSSNSSDSSLEKDVNVPAVSSKEENISVETNTCGNKTDDKKETTGSNGSGDEKHSAHNQRVLRSSHRNGGNGQNNGGSSSTPPPPPAPSTTATGSTTSSPVTVMATSNVPEQSFDNSSPPQTSTQRQTPTPPLPSTTNISGETSYSPAISKSPPTNSTVLSEEKSAESVESSGSLQQSSLQNSVELHPRKRKMKQSKESQGITSSTAEPADPTCSTVDVHPHEQPISNCYQLYLNIRKQVERRRKNLFPVQPKPPQGFKDYLMNRCTYVLAGNASHLSIQLTPPPPSLPEVMKELFTAQEKERYRLRMQHVIEKEKLVLSVEQEILRVHGRAARALANQSMPFSVCTILKDEEIYNFITPEQEEKDRNARSRYNGRLFLSWLQDVDDKWEKIKEAMLLRHHKEADSLNAVQKMDWEWKLKELGLCDYKVKPEIDDVQVPVVHVSDDFDLLPA